MAYLGNSPLNRLYSTQAVKLGQGQTAVNIGYTPGVTLFFKNGALLEPGADYTAADGSVLTLAKPASAGDVLTSISLAQFAVANALALSGGTLSGPLNGPASATDTLAGLIELATAAEAQALTDASRALTPKTLADAFKGPNQDVTSSSSGFIKLPNGLIWQYHRFVPTGGDNEYTVSLPFPFPNRILSSVVLPAGNNSTSLDPATVSRTTAADRFGYNIRTKNVGGSTLYFLSIGD